MQANVFNIDSSSISIGSVHVFLPHHFLTYFTACTLDIRSFGCISTAWVLQLSGCCLLWRLSGVIV